MTEPTNVAPPAGPDASPVQPIPKSEGLAIASLVLGIVSCTVVLNPLCIPSILAIVFGAISLRKVRAGTGGGEKQARAGLICGIVGAALMLLLEVFVVLLLALNHTWPY